MKWSKSKPKTDAIAAGGGGIDYTTRTASPTLAGNGTERYFMDVLHRCSAVR